MAPRKRTPAVRKSDEVAVSAAEKAARSGLALQLRGQGKSYQEIATQLGLSSWQEACLIVRDAIGALGARFNRERERLIEYERLKFLREGLTEALERGDAWAWTAHRDITDQMMRLGGLEQPRESAASVTHTINLPEWMAPAPLTIEGEAIDDDPPLIAGTAVVT